MMDRVIKPFNGQSEYTIFNNYILDYIMPKVSPNGWKCLCFIVRKTKGWHKTSDNLSFSQIKKGTGIKSDPTVSNALKELEDLKFILVQRHEGQWDSNTYTLNTALEIIVDKLTTIDSIVEATIDIKVEPTIESIDTKETKKKPKKSSNNIDSTSESSPTPPQQMFSALADLVKFDLDLLGETQRGKLNQAEKKMRDKGYTPADLEAFGLWWYANDWRGKQGQPPKLNDIRETWGQFKESRIKAAAPAALAPELPPPPILTPEQLTLQAAQAVLRQQMTRQTYDDLIRGVTTLPRTNGTFNLVAATEQARDLIQHRLYKTVAAVFKTIDPTIKEIEVII